MHIYVYAYKGNRKPILRGENDAARIKTETHTVKWEYSFLQDLFWRKPRNTLKFSEYDIVQILV